MKANARYSERWRCRGSILHLALVCLLVTSSLFAGGQSTTLSNSNSVGSGTSDLIQFCSWWMDSTSTRALFDSWAFCSMLKCPNVSYLLCSQSVWCSLERGWSWTYVRQVYLIVRNIILSGIEPRMSWICGTRPYNCSPPYRPSLGPKWRAWNKCLSRDQLNMWNLDPWGSLMSGSRPSELLVDLLKPCGENVDKVGFTLCIQGVFSGTSCVCSCVFRLRLRWHLALFC